MPALRSYGAVRDLAMSVAESAPNARASGHHTHEEPFREDFSSTSCSKGSNARGTQPDTTTVAARSSVSPLTAFIQAVLPLSINPDANRRVHIKGIAGNA